MSMTLPLLVLMYALSNSRQKFDLKYQMPKHNIHVNLFFFLHKSLPFCLQKQSLWANDSNGNFELD